MTENYSHILGRKGSKDIFMAVSQPIKGSPPPIRNELEHSTLLLSQIDRLVTNYKVATDKLEDANRHFIKVKTEDLKSFDIERLESKRGEKVEIVNVLLATNEIILDVPSLELNVLKGKITKYGTELTPGRGKTPPRPCNQDLVAPICEIKNIVEQDVISEDLLLEDPNSAFWVEFECRGGYIKNEHNPSTFTQMAQIEDKFELQQFQSFIAAERVFFFGYLTIKQIKKAIDISDCIFQVDKASSAIKNWMAIEYKNISNKQIASLNITPPSETSARIAILDSGVAVRHPLLKPFVQNCYNVIPNNDLAGDLDGHGTQMAGVCIYGNSLITVLEKGSYEQNVLIDSATLYPNTEEESFWPKLTQDAITAIKSASINNHVFTMAVTANNKDSKPITHWSQSLDQLIYNDGENTNLMLVSVGNINRGLYNHENYPKENIENWDIHDPAQSINALTIGAYTEKSELHIQDYKEFEVVAPCQGLSPYSSTNNLNHCIKPEVLFEGGNLMYNEQSLTDDPLISEITTNKEFATSSALCSFNATSCATALASNYSAQIWNKYPELRAETIRGLIVHSAQWNDTLKSQFAQKDELLSACGYGIPNLEYALYSTPKRATVIIEDEILNQDEEGNREIKKYKIPVPEDILTLDMNASANLKVTLSYFAEPNEPEKKTRNTYRGLDLDWDVQGYDVTDEEFDMHLNNIYRKEYNEGRDRDERFSSSTINQYDWKIGKTRRNKGTVQSDELETLVSISEIVGSRGIAVFPRLGWWDKKSEFKHQKLHFSLIITVEIFTEKDIDIYTPIKAAVGIPIIQEIKTEIEI